MTLLEWGEVLYRPPSLLLGGAGAAVALIAGYAASLQLWGVGAILFVSGAAIGIFVGAHYEELDEVLRRVTASERKRRKK
jgi:hypothetical protein